MTQKSSTRPQVRRDHPLSLSISISGGKETNKDSLIWRSVLSDGPGPSSLERGTREGECPSCPDPVAPRGAVYESGCLGMQPQSGGKFRPRLNMGERPIANKYRERVKECLKLSGGKRMGAGDASWSDAEQSNPVCRSIRGVDRRGLRW
ncbi:unnamed protein product [Brassica napus]|uniref:(rape) hypothetical protein n=1 Tax=Brassica napus TaxID=3708 RepID=A0A816XZS6_BRANA|nr:unnamed protein product [Brassica napus]